MKTESIKHWNNPVIEKYVQFTYIKLLMITMELPAWIEFIVSIKTRNKKCFSNIFSYRIFFWNGLWNEQLIIIRLWWMPKIEAVSIHKTQLFSFKKEFFFSFVRF